MCYSMLKIFGFVKGDCVGLGGEVGFFFESVKFFLYGYVGVL